MSISKILLTFLSNIISAILTIAIAVSAAIYISGCSSDQEQSSVSGADSEHIAFPAFPNFPTLPAPPGGTVTVTTPATTTTSTAPVSSEKTETLSYSGRWNGDRPTWYGSKKLSAYPATITIDITGCVTRTIKHNGTRYQDSQLIVKQSDVSGRGMAVVAAASCKSTSASVRY